MEQDGDDFGPLYVDILKPCVPVAEPHFFNDQNPSNLHTSSELSANVYKDYDRFLLSECGVNGAADEFDDVIFDVEMEQKDVEFDSKGLDVEVKNDKMVEENEINVVGDMMDEENDYLELYAGVCESFDMVCEHSENGAEGKNDKMVEENEIDVIRDMMAEENDDLELDTGVSKSFDMVCEHNENGVEDLWGLTNDDICANEEDSESDESLDIIIEDLNDHTAGNDKKDIEEKENDHCAESDKKELGNNCDDPDDLDDLEPRDVTNMKTELGIDVETRVGHSYQSWHTMSKGVNSVFMSQTFDTVSKGEENQLNLVRNADYNYRCTRFSYLPPAFRRAFDIEDKHQKYKPWKLPGANLSDFFNFDLDEEKWQNYRKQMMQLLQTSPPSKAVGYISEQLQLKNALGQQTREAIQVDISRVERVACLENHHQSVRNSDAIIEIVFVDSPDETESFTKELKDCALDDNKTRPTTIHKIINGDKILPFPLDGSCHLISPEERTSHWVSINYAQEGRQWTNFKSMERIKKDHISYPYWSMHLDHPKEKSEADQGHSGELLEYDKVTPTYVNEDAGKNNEGQTTVLNRLEDDRGEKSWRQGDSNYKKSLKQPDESKSANVYDNQDESKSANVYDNQEIPGNGFDNCRMRIEETLSQTDHHEGNDDNKFNKGSAVEEDFNGEQVTEPIDNHEQELPNNCNLVKGNEVIYDDQNHEAKREENMNEESREMQVSPKARRDEMKQLMSNINCFMSEVDELVHSHKHEHGICCLR